MEQKLETKRADPVKEKLELWQAEKGRLSKPNKPWLPKYKKLVETQMPTGISNSSTQNTSSLKSGGVKPKASVARQPISQNSDMKSRRVLLDEWKKEKRLKDAFTKELKGKERRWTVCGTATNNSVRDSGSFDWLNQNQSLLSRKSFFNKADSSDDVATGHVQTAPQTKKLFSRNQRYIEMAQKAYLKHQQKAKPVETKVAINKENIQPGARDVKKDEAKTSAPVVKAKPPLPRVNASKVSITSTSSSNMPASGTSSKVSTVNSNIQAIKQKKPVVGAKSVIPVRPTRAQLLAAKPPVKPHSVKPDMAITVANSSSINSRKSICVPNIGSKGIGVSISALNRNITQKETKAPWISGTTLGSTPKLAHRPKPVTGRENLTKNGGGILKTGCKNPTTLKVKKSVAFISPIISPYTPSINERLVNWLIENNHSPYEYRNLQSLVADTSLPEIQPLDFEMEENMKSPGTPDTITLTTKESGEEANLKKYRDLLAELNQLLQNSFPANEASEWLDLMYEKVPEVRLMSGYWLCRARVSLSSGCSQDDVTELIEQGINAGAQPVQELVRFKNRKARNSTPRPKFRCQKENIFNSTLIKYKLNEMNPQPIEEKAVETSVAVTPVRRSHRIKTFCSSEKTFATIDEIPDELKLRLVLTPNKFLNVDEPTAVDKDF